MGAFIICGFENSWCEFAQSRFSELGVASAKTSSKFGVSAQDFLDKIHASHAAISEDGLISEKFTLGRAWDLAAAALFIENAEAGYWSWSDPRHINLLNYWADFDPACDFVLIYDTIASSVAEHLESSENGYAEFAQRQIAWSKFHEAMLRFYRANSERCSLIHLSRFEGLGRDFSSHIAARFDIPERLLNASRHLRSSYLARLLAQAIVLQDEEDERIFSDLQSMADLGDPNSNSWSAEELQRANDEFAEIQINKQKLTETELRNRELVEALESETARANRMGVTIEDLSEKLSNLESERLAMAGGFGAVSKNPNHPSFRDRAEGAIRPRVGADGRTDMVEQNELLKLQLAQSREELELYFNKYQQTRNELDQLGNNEASLADDRRRQKSAEEESPIAVSIDLRNHVLGKGWHSAEPQGRWIGAEDISTLTLPGLTKKDHVLKFRIVDAMSLEHLEALHILYNGQALQQKFTPFVDDAGRLAALRRMRTKFQRIEKPLPAELSVRLTREKIVKSPQPGVISISTAPAISPAISGGADSRKLSICFERVEILELS